MSLGWTFSHLAIRSFSESPASVLAASGINRPHGLSLQVLQDTAPHQSITVAQVSSLGCRTYSQVLRIRAETSWGGWVGSRNNSFAHHRNKRERLLVNEQYQHTLGVPFLVDFFCVPCRLKNECLFNCNPYDLSRVYWKYTNEVV